MDIQQYILDHIGKEDEYLYRLWRETNKHLLYGRMVSGHLQGKVLKMLVEMINPKNILEIGTFSGYSAICMARGGSIVHTFEIEDELEDFTRKWIEESDVADKIHFHIGDALKEAPKLGITFDFIFIDGNKRLYKNYYDMAMQILDIGGYIVADNTLWDGHVIDKEYADDPQTRGIMEFNDIVASDERVEKIILPLRDGLSIIKRIK